MNRSISLPVKIEHVRERRCGNPDSRVDNAEIDMLSAFHARFASLDRYLAALVAVRLHPIAPCIGTTESENA